MDREPTCQPNTAANVPDADKAAVSPKPKLTLAAKICSWTVVLLGVAVVRYFELPQIRGYLITFVLATLAAVVAHKLSQKRQPGSDESPLEQHPAADE